MADHIKNADLTASDVADQWMLIAEDGDMKVYKREQEIDGVVVDPIKAVHTVKVRANKSNHFSCPKYYTVPYNTYLHSGITEI